MNTVSFDSLTRNAAGGGTPRRSLLTLGAAGVAAALAAPLTVDAKKKRRKKKKPQQSPPPAAADRCAPQVAECTTSVTNIFCKSQPEKCPALTACCSNLGTCEASQFFSCLLLASIG